MKCTYSFTSFSQFLPSPHAWLSALAPGGTVTKGAGLVSSCVHRATRIAGEGGRSVVHVSEWNACLSSKHFAHHQVQLGSLGYRSVSLQKLSCLIDCFHATPKEKFKLWSHHICFCTSSGILKRTSMKKMRNTSKAHQKKMRAYLLFGYIWTERILKIHFKKETVMLT